MNIRVGDLVTYRTYANEDVPALVMQVWDDGAGYLIRAASLEIRYPRGDIRRAEVINEGHAIAGTWRHTSTHVEMCACCEREYVLTRRETITAHFTPGSCFELCPGSGLAPLAE